ncbi:MAG TPA: hypothetical protein VIT45_15210 [Allosphingosinicella sp.]
MTRFAAPILSALSLASLSLAAAAPAVAAGPYYRAELAAPASSGQVIARGLIWKCGAEACVAGKSNSRPAIDCAALVREAGALRSFTVQGRALSDSDLEKCNARAK